MLQIRDVMTRHVFSVTPETTLRETADLFARHHISGAPVLAGHRVVGVVSATDLVEFMASNDGRRFEPDDRSESGSEKLTREEFENESSSLFFGDRALENNDGEREPFRMDDAPQDDYFNEHTVEEVMTRAVCALPPEAELGEAAQYMWREGIHRLLVLEGGHLLGILSMSDVARILATVS